LPRRVPGSSEAGTAVGGASVCRVGAVAVGGGAVGGTQSRPIGNAVGGCMALATCSRIKDFGVPARDVRRCGGGGSRSDPGGD